jgi:hypothetical protein
MLEHEIGERAPRVYSDAREVDVGSSCWFHRQEGGCGTDASGVLLIDQCQHARGVRTGYANARHVATRQSDHASRFLSLVVGQFENKCPTNFRKP